MHRVNKLTNHLKGSQAVLPTKEDNDVVIVSALRTPIGRAKKGYYKDATPDTLLSTVLKAILEQTKIDPSIIGDVVIGNVLQPGSAAIVSRMAQLQAGIPSSVPIHTVNRQCSSGLQAFACVASAIKSGYYDVGIAGGVESMTLTDMASTAPDVCWEKVYDIDDARDCTTPMGVTSENVAEKFKISREEQDNFACESHKKATVAQENGWFDNEIVPTTVNRDDENGDSHEITVSKDEGIRPNTTKEKLSKLRASFKENGTTTAGNSSQVSDGAAAVLLMTRSKAKELGLRVLGRFVSYAVAGVPPSIMGIGPAIAIPKALHHANKSIGEIDLFEINEAFASQAVYCVKELNIPFEKVNPKGGAIALGHPLGCTGARQIATLIHELLRQNKKSGVVSMCIGTGMGAAAIFEAEF